MSTENVVLGYIIPSQGLSDFYTIEISIRIRISEDQLYFLIFEKRYIFILSPILYLRHSIIRRIMSLSICLYYAKIDKITSDDLHLVPIRQSMYSCNQITSRVYSSIQIKKLTRTNHIEGSKEALRCRESYSIIIKKLII